MRIQSVKNLGLAAVLAAGLASQGCANMSDTDRRVGTGVGIGAVTGALISGGRAGPTAVGAVLGGVGGWLYDQNRKRYYRYDSRGRRIYR